MERGCASMPLGSLHPLGSIHIASRPKFSCMHKHEEGLFFFFDYNRIFLNQKRLHTYVAHTQNHQETTRRRLGILNSVPCSLITHMNYLLSPQKNVSGIRARCNRKCQTDTCTWSRTTIWEEKTETKWLALRVFERRSCVSQAHANIHLNRHLLA